MRKYLLCLSFMIASVLVHAESSKPPIRIGFFGPMSGKFSLDGIQSKRGADLAVQEINEAGGVDGRPLELVIDDDQNDREQAVTIAHRLAESDSVVAVLGSAHSLSLVAAAPVFNEKKLPLLVTYASALSVVKGYSYVYRWGQLADTEGYILAHYALREKNWKRVAILVQDEEFGRGIANGLKKGIEKWGGEIVYEKMFPTGEKEFRSYLTDIQGVKADVVIGTGFGMSHVFILKQGKQAGVFPAAHYLGPCTISEINFINLAGDDGDGAIGAMEFLTGTNAPKLPAFLKRWTAAYGAQIPVDHYAALNYESVYVLAQVLKTNGVSREGVLKGLSSLKNYRSLDGSIVSMTPVREVQRTLDIGQFDSRRNIFRLLERVTDPKLIDPSRWTTDDR